jgi:hypothetical protein
VLTFFKQKLSRLLRIAICSLLFLFFWKYSTAGAFFFFYVNPAHLFVCMPLLCVVITDVIKMFMREQEAKK